MSTRFYVNWPLQPGPVTLDGPEARHLAVVCRLRPGDAVCLFNGDGHEYPARILRAGKKSVEIDVESVQSPQRELHFRLEAAAPLPKGDRAQFLIEKLTEIGVAAFVPLECNRSVVHPRETKLEKLQRYVIEASKQCGRNVLMDITPLAAWEAYVSQPPQPGELRLLAHPQADSIGQTFLSAIGERQPGKPASRRVAVGPEGGLTDKEVTLAARHGWKLVGLGPRILRVETAALAMALLASGLQAWFE